MKTSHALLILALVLIAGTWFRLASAQSASVWYPDTSGPVYVIGGMTDGCAQWSSNVLTSSGSVCGGAGGVFPFTPTASGNATSTTLIFNAGFIANASSTLTKIGNLSSNGFIKTSGGNGTLSIDTNTYLTAESDPVWTADKPSYLTSATAASTYEPIVSAGTISDYYRGDKTWAATSTLRLTKSQITDFGGPYLTAETDPVVKAINGIVKSNGVTISAAVSGTDYAPATSGSSILKGNGLGGFSSAANGTDYTLLTAKTCANQVLTAATAAGVFTCSTVSNAMLANSTISGVALGSNLNALTATNGTLTFSGSYDGSTARTVGLNLGSPNTWTALQTFALASSTQFSAASETFYIDSTGKVVAKDTTNNWTGRLSPTHSFVLGAATTTQWTASTTGSAYSPFLVMPFAGTLRQVRCATDASFLGVNVQVNGSNATPSYFVASSTVGLVLFTGGNTFTASQKILVNFGTTTTASATQANCTFDVTET